MAFGVRRSGGSPPRPPSPSQGDRRYRRRVLKPLRSGLGGYMRRTKLINRVLRAQEPPPKRPEWRWQPFWCQYCGARFADRNELLAHLEAEKQRDQTTSEP